MGNKMIMLFCFIFFGLALSPTEASAFRGGGGFVRASTTYRPGVGVTRSTTVAAGRYHTPAVLPAYRPGLAYPGVAVRTARNVARRVAYRTAAGYSYYYGAPIYVLPSPSCEAVIWEGMSVYNCAGVMYLYEDSQYYPLEG